MFTTLNIHQPRSMEEREEHSSWPPLLLSTPVCRCHARYHHAPKFKKHTTQCDQTLNELKAVPASQQMMATERREVTFSVQKAPWI